MVLTLAFILVGALQAVPAQAAAPPTSEPTRPPDCLTCAPASAEARPSLITLPRWIVRPAPVYPSVAMAHGVPEGSVQLTCRVQPDGALGVCDIVTESPAGVGFGAAALEGARMARLQPSSGPAYPADARVNFTSRFLLN